MSAILRVSSLLFAAGIGLTAAPTRAADGTLGPAPAPVALSGSELWSLRPTRVAAAVAAVQPLGKRVPLADLPAERRQVRVVYEGYSASGPLKPSH